VAVPVFDTAASAVAATATSVTANKATTGASRIILAVSFSLGTGVTCTGVARDPAGANEALTAVQAKVDPGGFEVALWRLLAPPTAANDYKASFNGAAANCAILLASYTTVDQTTPFLTPVTASGTSTTPAVGPVTDASTNDFVIGVYESFNVNGRTLDGNGRVDDGFFPALALLFDKAGTGANISFSWPQTNSATWAAIAATLKGTATGDTLFAQGVM
jgi:hypothetical protein